MRFSLRSQRGVHCWSYHLLSTTLHVKSRTEIRNALNMKMGNFQELLSLRKLQTGIHHIEIMIDAINQLWNSVVLWSTRRLQKQHQIWSSIRYLLVQGKFKSQVIITLDWHCRETSMSVMNLTQGWLRD